MLDDEEYQRMYSDFRNAGANWPLDRLETAMRFLMGAGYRAEANWGAIDAIADLLRFQLTGATV